VTDTIPTPAPASSVPAARGRVHALAVRAARTTASHAVRGLASGAGSAAGGFLVWWLLNH
jgi:hypothetical protein